MIDAGDGRRPGGRGDGFLPLGLEWKVTRTWLVIINPLGIALPAPQLSGVPYTYLQYRVAIGLEYYAR